MNSSNLPVATKPVINFGVLFILAFALIVGARPVRAAAVQGVRVGVACAISSGEGS